MAEDVVEVEEDGGAGDGEAGLLRPGAALAEARGAGARVDDPDGFDAHALVVACAVLEIGIGVVGGEDFDYEEGRVDEDLGLRNERGEDEVGDADAGGANLDALLGQYNHRPFSFVCSKPDGEKRLNSCVFPLAHVTLLEFAIDEVAVGPVARCEVLRDGELGGVRHMRMMYTAHFQVRVGHVSSDRFGRDALCVVRRCCDGRRVGSSYKIR